MRLLLINLLVTLGLLAVVEGGVRLFVPGITPTGTDARLVADSVYGAVPGLRPGAVGTSNGARFAVDRHGFWRYAAAADTSRPAWLFLGDSVTMGIGVDPDATFAGLAAARSPAWSVLNPSLIGYSSRDYRVLLDHLTRSGGPFRVERATIFWCLNDVYAAAPGLGEPGRVVRRVGGPALAFLRRSSYTYHWLKDAFFDRPLAYLEHDRRLYEGPPLEGALEDLRAMARLADERGVRLEVVLLPYAAQLRRGAPPEALAPQTLLRDALAEIGLPTHDPLPYLLAHAARPEVLYLYGDGIHFSAEGHAVVARFLAERLGL